LYIIIQSSILTFAEKNLHFYPNHKASKKLGQCFGVTLLIKKPYMDRHEAWVRSQWFINRIWK